MTFSITEAEFERDVHGALQKVRQGAEVIIERDGRPVAVLTQPVGIVPQAPEFPEPLSS